MHPSLHIRAHLHYLTRYYTRRYACRNESASDDAHLPYSGASKTKPIPTSHIYSHVLCFASFALLEQVSRLGVSPLRTSLPSSIRATGSFASCFGSIPSFSAQATPYQRVLVQRLGRKFGCHHCGTRQLLSFGKSFIADHMPPTQIARLRNKALWRQLLNWPVQQVLRPQCESCCAIQGSAVRIGAHVAVYNLKPRLVILAPVLAVWLIENPYFGKSIKEHTNSMVDVCLDGYRGMKSLVDQPK